MKRTNIHIFAALALLFALAACTQDEAGFLSEGAEGTPIVFTATGLNPAATATAGTRAPVDGNWEGVQSVAVLMDGTVKAYDVTPTNATLTSTDPHYWTNHKDITVTAWWPYTAGETSPPAVKVKANQSARKDFEGSDLIVADGQTVTYGSPTLRFTHRTARVTIVLTDYTEESMGVQLTGLSTEGGNPAEIIPYDKGSNTYTALVAPQSVAAGTAFITCTFTNGKTFVYKMKNATDWQAGGEYTYTVSLAAAKDPGYTIEGNGSYTVTSADGLMNVAELVNGGKTDINITLDKNIDLTGKDWTPIGTSFDNSYTGTFDGGNHTITGLKIDQSGTDNVGLIGRLGSGGKVQDVTLTEVNVTGGTYVGGIAGQTDGTVENCSVNGTVTGQNQTGGIVGRNFSTISGCSAEGTVTGNTNVGGISGLCVPNYDTGTGSLIGSTIEGCHSTAAVSGISSVGGVVGNLGNGCSLMACYSTGNVTATSTDGSFVGGVVGINSQGTVTGCYHATGEITSLGGGRIGGIVGENYIGTVAACYWDSNLSSGTGSNNGRDDTHKVDGTDVTWQTAVVAMNTALQSAGSEWHYELTGELPTLKNSKPSGGKSSA
ncbi:fimbrillin family protein [Bacteroides ovatus]|nr:fimbrillin family protein [Bacteroides ovatus]